MNCRPCEICGESPCYLICPTQDPYAGRPWEEHCDYEAGVDRYDGFQDRDSTYDAEEDHNDSSSAPKTEPVTPPVELDPNDILF